MRALVLSCALLTAFAVPAAAAPAKFLKIDVVQKSQGHHARRTDDGPRQVHIRVPLALAKGVLEMAASGDIEVQGKRVKDLKIDQFEKMIAEAVPGDLLLEVTTDKGDLVKVTVE